MNKTKELSQQAKDRSTGKIAVTGLGCCCGAGSGVRTVQQNIDHPLVRCLTSRAELFSHSVYNAAAGDPLGSAVAVTGIIADGLQEDRTLRITASYGSIELCCRCHHSLPGGEA